VRGCGTLAQHRMGALRHILDLNTRHGAIVTPQAPNHNRPTIGS
jgi:hypothetical protein